MNRTKSKLDIKQLDKKFARLLKKLTPEDVKEWLKKDRSQIPSSTGTK